MDLTFSLEPDPRRFRELVGGFLGADPVERTSPITVLDGILSGLYDEWRLAAVQTPGGAVTGCTVQTPPFNVIVTTADARAAHALAIGLRQQGVDLPGAVGVGSAVLEFAATFCQGTDRTPTQTAAMRLFRLDALVPPRPAVGSARLARSDDIDLVVDWFEAFRTEAGMPAFTDARRAVTNRVADGRLWVWVTDGQPVSFLARSPIISDHARVGPVYTPPEHRGRGCASNLVAAASAQLLALGAVPTLFTDLANPTSNAIYRAIGYTAVADAYEIEFAAA